MQLNKTLKKKLLHKHYLSKFNSNNKGSFFDDSTHYAFYQKVLNILHNHKKLQSSKKFFLCKQQIPTGKYMIDAYPKLSMLHICLSIEGAITTILLN